MSNHDGSYMLNEVLKTLDEYNFFDFIGKDKTCSFISDILKISNYYDCNPGEILENIGEKLGICYICKSITDKFIDGICLNCDSRIAQI